MTVGLHRASRARRVEAFEGVSLYAIVSQRFSDLIAIPRGTVMYRLRLALIALSMLVSALAIAADVADTPQGAPAGATLESRFDAQIQPAELSDWMHRLASEPNHVGSAHDKANAEWILRQFQEWGWDAHIESFRVLYPTPLSESLTLLGAQPFKATLTEPPVAGDRTTLHNKEGLPAYVAFQGDGDVSAPLVYVNYGMEADYRVLSRLGVSVKGKIVIARYGGGWRGLKPRLALEHGAVGCIIYSDPSDDGYALDDVYPKGPQRPAGGIQRGSVVDMTLYPGDPLTPGVGATESAARLALADVRTIVRIPTLPISYGDAAHFMAALDGRVVPKDWRGALPITYRVGGSAARVHLQVKSDWSLKTIYDVVAILKGSTLPDQWILRGNHHDGWVYGASDPQSGQVALLSEAKALGQLAASGWRPKRTLVYLSWDGEEPALFGSTEWAETHASELKRKALIYLNSDENTRGTLSVEGTPTYQALIDSVTERLVDPETGATVSARERAVLEVAGSSPGASGREKAAAKLAGDPHHTIPIGAMGSGSDYSPFLQHLGLAALNFGYGDEGDLGGVYHSAYDTWEHHSRFVDPGFAYDALLAKTVGHVVLRLADADLPLEQFGDFADDVSTYVRELKELAEDRREQARNQAKLIAMDAYRLADDPTLSSGPPVPRQAVPHFDFAPLEDATDHLKRSATEFDQALREQGATLPVLARQQLFERLSDINQLLAPEVGLPGRDWYKNLLYAPGRQTGYGAKTMPGVREAIEDERWSDVDRYAQLTASALEQYAARLDECTQLIHGGAVSH
jgi:N-acetylated-alpha-linked acidic dipeptidase